MSKQQITTDRKSYSIVMKTEPRNSLKTAAENIIGFLKQTNRNNSNATPNKLKKFTETRVKISKRLQAELNNHHHDPTSFYSNFNISRKNKNSAAWKYRAQIFQKESNRNNQLPHNNYTQNVNGSYFQYNTNRQETEMTILPMIRNATNENPEASITPLLNKKKVLEPAKLEIISLKKHVNDNYEIEEVELTNKNRKGQSQNNGSNLQIRKKHNKFQTEIVEEDQRFQLEKKSAMSTKRPMIITTTGTAHKNHRHKYPKTIDIYGGWQKQKTSSQWGFSIYDVVGSRGANRKK